MEGLPGEGVCRSGSFFRLPPAKGLRALAMMSAAQVLQYGPESASRLQFLHLALAMIKALGGRVENSTIPFLSLHAQVASVSSPTTACKRRRLLGVGSTGASSIAGQPGPEPEQLQQVVAGADEQPFPVDLLQAPQQELPETPALLDLSEHRLRRLA